MPVIGKVVKIKSNPRGFVVHKPDPLPDGVDVPFTEVSADDLLVASAAFGKGCDVSVSGTPPACTGIETV